ncbi:MAG: hypothetical protein WA913_03280, partial [Pricia sp.]
MKTEKLVLPAVVGLLLIASCSKDDSANPSMGENQIVDEVAVADLEDSIEEEATVEGQDVFLEDYSFMAESNKGFLFAPDVISFEAEGLYPEGVEFDFRRNRFYVGSLTRGS